MIEIGADAPDFELVDQFNQPFSMRKHRGVSAVMLLFYPLDWTPTCSSEVPELDALATDFIDLASTRAAAISCDSRFSHLAWCASLEGRPGRPGVRIPILADYMPRGRVSKAYGAFIPSEEISDRATVIVDREGIVRYAQSVGKYGRRNIPELLAVAKKITGPGQVTTMPAGNMPPTGVLYVTRTCGHCRHARQAVTNLGIDTLKVRFVGKDGGDPDAQDSFLAEVKSREVPALVIAGRAPITGSDKIIAELARHARPEITPRALV